MIPLTFLVPPTSSGLVWLLPRTPETTPPMNELAPATNEYGGFACTDTRKAVQASCVRLVGMNANRSTQASDLTIATGLITSQPVSEQSLSFVGVAVRSPVPEYG